MRRSTHSLLIGCLLVLFTVSAGCSGINPLNGGDETKPSDVSYDWNTSANASLDLGTDRYRSVYTLSKADPRTFSVYEEDIVAGEKSIEVEALKYRYPNGTVISTNDSKRFNVSEEKSKTDIHLPGKGGQVAFITDKERRSLTIPVFLKSEDNDEESVNRSYEVTLPPNMEVGVPFLGRVTPENDEKNTVDGRTQLRWNTVSGDTISIRYYLHRDMLMLGGVLGIGLLVGLGGLGYYLVQIRSLKRVREEIEIEDDEI